MKGWLLALFGDRLITKGLIAHSGAAWFKITLSTPDWPDKQI